MKQRVFVSYEAEDRPYAKKLLSHLGDLDFSGLLDQADVSANNYVMKTIRSKLIASNAVLVLVSPRSITSQWVDFEVGASQALGKKILPILVEGENLESQLPKALQGIEFVDARNANIEDVVRKIRDSLEL